MIHTKDLEKVIALALASAYVEGERPLSLMVISDRPESGKTDLVNKFQNNTGLAFLSDITAYAMWRDFGAKLGQGEIKHFIIPEFLAPISRQSQTVASFIATLQMLIEEGLKEIHTGFLDPIILDSPVTIGAIVCMPRDAFASNKLSWEISGFLSRFLVVTYKYNNTTVEKIFDSIEKREYLEETKVDLHFSKEATTIEIPKGIARKCRTLAEEITTKARQAGKLYGYRELKNIFKLIASNVILDRCQGSDRTTVNEKDFQEISRLSYLFTEDFNPLEERGENGN